MNKACRNIVTAYGTNEDISNMMESLSDGTNAVVMDKFFPTPPELVEATKAGVISPSLMERFGAMDVGSWRLNNWGCPVDVLSSRVLHDIKSKFDPEALKALTPEQQQEASKYERAVSIEFTTTETPNMFALRISTQYKDARMHFSYDSEAEDVSGYIVAKGGEVIGHEHYSSCLKAIRLHLEPLTDESGSLLDSLVGKGVDSD